MTEYKDRCDMNEQTSSDINSLLEELCNEAKELVVRLLPPIDYGENQYADRLYEILESIGSLNLK